MQGCVGVSGVIANGDGDGDGDGSTETMGAVDILQRWQPGSDERETSWGQGVAGVPCQDGIRS